jgi:hypothetical protein
MCHIYPQTNIQTISNTKSKSPSYSSTYNGEVDKQSLVSPPEQFIDTNKNNLKKTDDKDIENWNLDADQENMVEMQNKNERLLLIPLTRDTMRSSFRRSEQPNLTSHISMVSLASSGSQDSSGSNERSKSTIHSRRKYKKNQAMRDLGCEYEKNVDCEKLFADLVLYFPALTSLEHLFGADRQTKTRKDFIGELLNDGYDEDTPKIFEKTGKNMKFNIPTFERMNQELQLSLVTKLEVLKEEESCIELECVENGKELQRLEERFREAATDYEVAKFKLHGSEIEKIVSLILSLTGRLVKIVNALDNMDWNGVDERDDLERKRDKLADQLE